MLKEFLKYKKVTAIVLLISVVGLLIPFHFAQALGFFSIANIATDAILLVIGTLIDFVSSIFGLVLLPLSASIVNWVFGALDSIQYIKNPVVETGWKISRDIANMGFILVLLFMGLSTIIKYDTYGIKQLLPRIILIALLINFSLVIGGVFIDMGNDLGFYFTTGGNENAKVGDTIMVAAAITKSLETDPALEERLRENDDLGKTVFINALMKLVFTIIMVFLLLAMALIMIFRIIFLWILLILAPLAWIAYIIPGAKQYWTMWWKSFLQWAFFPAIFGFFIFLAVSIGLGLGTGTIDLGPNTKLVEGLRETATVPFSSLALLLQYITVIMIIFFGLSQAQKWGLHGASTAIKLGTGAKNWTLGKAKGYAGRKTTSIVGAGAQKALYDKEGKLRTGFRGLAAVPLVKQVLRAPIAALNARKKQISEAEKGHDSQTTENLQILYKTSDTDNRIAIASILAKRGKLEESDLIKKGDIAGTMKAAMTVGMEKDLLMAAPDIAIENNVVNNNRVETVNKIEKILSEIKPADIAKMSDGVLERLRTNPASAASFNVLMESIVGNWGGRQIAKMADEGQRQNISSIRDFLIPYGNSETSRLAAIETVLGNKSMANYLRSSPGGKEIIDLT